MMNNKKYIKYLLTAITLAALSACGDADVNDPRGSTKAPGQVSVREVKNYKGRSVIYYDMPNDVNLRYVRAEFNPRPNETADVQASFYSDSLVLEGFATAGVHDVKIYSISYGETRSEPLTVTVEPQTPPYLDVAVNMDITPSFSGMYVKYTNERVNDLAIQILRKEHNSGLWQQIHTQYTSLPKGEFAVRGQEAVATDFGFCVRDRWGNTTQIREENLTPWFEQQCDKMLFQKVILPTDSHECHTWGGAGHASLQNDISKIWDGVITDAPAYQTKTNVTLPNHFTFEMGDKYQISRFVMFSRINANHSNIFRAGHVRKFILWGSNNPNNDGSFDNTWFKIGEYESFRPSGETVIWHATTSPLTNEDRAIATDGEEFIIPEGTESFRYVRIQTLQTWGAVVYPHISEVTFFGSVAQ